MKQICRKKFVRIFVVIVFILLAHTRAEAETRFGQFAPEKKLPAEFNFDEIWFDSGGEKIIPTISTRWLTVVFDPRFTNVNEYSGEAGGTYESFIQEKAKAMITSYSGLTDFLYDKNLAEDACFFRLREGMSLPELKQLVIQLDQDEAVSYTHPAIIIDDKTYAFFNTFRLTWKEGVETSRQDRLLKQASVEFDKPAKVYRANVFDIPFFTALHLLGDDISVLGAAPYLTEIKPALEARLDLAMTGAHIGDSIPFTLTIAFSDRISLDPSSLATINLRPFNLQQDLFDATFTPYDPSKLVLHSPVVISGTITCYASGEFVLPPVTISYSCQECSGNPVRTFETRTIPLKVSSLVPSAKDSNHLLVPSTVIQPDYQSDVLKTRKNLTLTLALAAFSIFIILACWLLTLFYREKKEQQVLLERRSDELLAEELRVALLAPPSDPHWQYLAHAGSLIRSFIAARFHVPREQLGGSGNRFVHTVGDQMPERCVTLLRAVLGDIDDAVARELETCPDITKIQSDIKALLDLTAPQNNQTVKNKK